MLPTLLVAALAAPAADLVTKLPGFNMTGIPFKVYSGYLHVPGPFSLTEYDSLNIHYQLHTSQAGARSPVVTWHQGGPGGSSIDVGLYTEMGYFQISDTGSYTNDFAWNKVPGTSSATTASMPPLLGHRPNALRRSRTCST